MRLLGFPAGAGQLQRQGQIYDVVAGFAEALAGVPCTGRVTRCLCGCVDLVGAMVAGQREEDAAVRIGIVGAKIFSVGAIGGWNHEPERNFRAFEWQLVACHAGSGAASWCHAAITEGTHDDGYTGIGTADLVGAIDGTGSEASAKRGCHQDRHHDHGAHGLFTSRPHI